MKMLNKKGPKSNLYGIPKVTLLIKGLLFIAQNLMKYNVIETSVQFTTGVLHEARQTVAD